MTVSVKKRGIAVITATAIQRSKKRQATYLIRVRLSHLMLNQGDVYYPENII